MIAHGFIVVELWGNCYLALEPIKVSKKTRNMTIEFHWLRSRPRVTPLVKLLVDLTTCPDSFAEYDTPEGEEDIKLWNSTTGKELTSGRRIFLRTESPRQRPLPSFELLEMQWYLQRVVPYLLLRNSARRDNMITPTMIRIVSCLILTKAKTTPTMTMMISIAVTRSVMAACFDAFQRRPPSHRTQLGSISLL